MGVWGAGVKTGPPESAAEVARHGLAATVDDAAMGDVAGPRDTPAQGRGQPQARSCM